MGVGLLGMSVFRGVAAEEAGRKVEVGDGNTARVDASRVAVAGEVGVMVGVLRKSGRGISGGTLCGLTRMKATSSKQKITPLRKRPIRRYLMVRMGAKYQGGGGTCQVARRVAVNRKS
jgi:hypothetical protein